MKMRSTHPLLYTALALLMCHVPSALAAQTRSTAPTPILTVTHPSEGQVISGDLDVAVAVQEGSVTRRYSTEAAYWDAGRGAWVYPGLLGTEFAGEAPTRIAGDSRVRLGGTATRWRIRVHSMDPPGSWGPWREFVWQGIPGQATSPRATTASASGTGGNQAVAIVVPRPAKAQDGAALLAEIDKNIAAAKKQIVLLNLKIAQEKLKIDSLQADINMTDALLNGTLKQGITPDTLKFVATVKALKTHIEDDENAIYASEEIIIKYRKQIKALEEQILVLQKQREALLAKL